MAKFFLRKKIQSRIADGHPWVFANEISSDGPHAQKGEVVELFSTNGSFIGKGFYNPDSAIRIRLFTRSKVDLLDKKFIEQKIQLAQKRRERLGFNNAYRLFHSDADGLSGLIIDRYDNTFVLQLLSAGIDKWKSEIVQVLSQLFSPKTIVERNDAHVRSLEKLLSSKAIIFGQPGGRAEVLLHGIRTTVDTLNGPATGGHLELLQNISRLQKPLVDAKTLEVFCGTGWWSLFAAQCGAKKIEAIDWEANYLTLLSENARLNGFKIQTIQANAFDALRKKTEDNERFDVIYFDPPPMNIQKEEAYRGLKELLVRVMKLIEPQGFLMGVFRGGHISTNQIQALLIDAAHDTKKQFRIIGRFGGPADFPQLPSMPEADFFQSVILQIE